MACATADRRKKGLPVSYIIRHYKHRRKEKDLRQKSLDSCNIKSQSVHFANILKILSSK